MTTLFKKHRNLIPIILLGGLCLWTFYQVLFVKVEFEGKLYDQSFTTKFWMGFAAVLINFGVYFLFRRYFKYFVFITLALGLLSVIEFSTAGVRLGLNSLELGGTAFLICLIYLGLNLKRLKFGLSSGDNISNTNVLDENKIDELKERYRYKSAEELVELLNDKRFTEEAKIAAQGILNERAKMPNS